MIHVYCGDGKGKTTCAMGLALRAIGRNMNVVIAQFLKGSATGEILQLEILDEVRVFRLDKELPFTFQMNEEEKSDALHQHNRIFQKAIQFVNTGYCDMLILDELCAAIETNLIDEIQVKNFINSVSNNVEVIITGRNPPKWVLTIANYITEMKPIKHPYNSGFSARAGIEF